MASGFISRSYPTRPLAPEGNTNPTDFEIRLLTIFPGRKGTNITCELWITKLHSTVHYNALSYCWGTSFARDSITISSSPFRPTQNLHDALSAVREIEQTNASSQSREAQPIFLWVDAVCINQEDNDEKAQQIQIMRDIYRFASTTYIWLGKGDGECEKICQTIPALASFATKLSRNVTSCCSKHTGSHTPREKLEHACSYVVSRLDNAGVLPPFGEERQVDMEARNLLKVLEAWCNNHEAVLRSSSYRDDSPREPLQPAFHGRQHAKDRAIQLLSSPKSLEISGARRRKIFNKTLEVHLRESGSPWWTSSGAFVSLVQLSWFRRVWVIQEVAFSRNPVLVYGDQPHVVDWDVFMTAITLADCMGLIPDHVTESDELISCTAFSFDQEREEKMSEGVSSGLDSSSLRPPTRASINNLLSTMRQFRPLLSTMPQDKIFALQGLVHSTIPPNYHDSPAHTYAKFAYRVMVETGSVGILEDAYNLDVKHGVEPMLELPSWVPDWSHSSFSLSYVSRSHCHRGLPNLVHSLRPQEPILAFDCAQRTKCHPALSTNGRSLKLSGVFVDQVNEVAKPRGKHPPIPKCLWWPLNRYLFTIESLDFHFERSHSFLSIVLESRSTVTHAMELLATYINIRIWRHRTYFTCEPLLVAFQHTLKAMPPLPEIQEDREIYASLAVESLADIVTGIVLRPLGFRNLYIAAVTVTLFCVVFGLLFVCHFLLLLVLLVFTWLPSIIVCELAKPFFDLRGTRYVQAAMKPGGQVLFILLSYALATTRYMDEHEPRKTRSGVRESDITGVSCENLIARTNGKLLCLVPRITVAGDYIVIFKGGEIPFVVREEAPGTQRWKLVGRCYVHGIMYGAAFDEGVCQDITVV